jgi:hypothetical protein
VERSGALGGEALQRGAFQALSSPSSGGTPHTILRVSRGGEEQ